MNPFTIRKRPPARRPKAAIPAAGGSLVPGVYNLGKCRCCPVCDIAGVLSAIPTLLMSFSGSGNGVSVSGSGTLTHVAPPYPWTSENTLFDPRFWYYGGGTYDVTADADDICGGVRTGQKFEFILGFCDIAQPVGPVEYNPLTSLGMGACFEGGWAGGALADCDCGNCGPTASVFGFSFELNVSLPPSSPFFELHGFSDGTEDPLMVDFSINPALWAGASCLVGIPGGGLRVLIEEP